MLSREDGAQQYVCVVYVCMCKVSKYEGVAVANDGR